MKKSMLDNLKRVVSNTLTDDIKMIDIDELHESADNFFVVENIEQFAQTILGQGGVKDNLIVKPLETGGYEIISGHRRRAAVQYLLDKGENIARVLPCLVQNYTDEDDKMLDLILMNVSARQISDQELWKCYETLDKILKEKKDKGEYYGRLRDDIANTLGVSASQVGKMQNVDKNAIEPVKEAVASGELSISTANEIAKLDKEEQSKITDLSKVQPKDIKKKAVATNSNSESKSSTDKTVDTNINDNISIHNDTTVLSPEEEMAIERSLVSQKEVSLSKWAQSLKQEQLQYLLDNGMYNSAIKGYVMLAAEEASFSKEQINALLGGIMKALKNYDKAEAENKFLSR